MVTDICFSFGFVSIHVHVRWGHTDKHGGEREMASINGMGGHDGTGKMQ